MESMSSLKQSFKAGAQLKQLVDLSVDLLQSTLTDEQVSLKERADLALRLLALEPDLSTPSGAPEVHLQVPTSETVAIRQNGVSRSIAPGPTEIANADKRALSQLSEEWRRWIFTNKQRKCNDEQLIATLISEGIDQEIARYAVKSTGVEASPPLQSVDPQQLQKLESIFTVKRQLGALSTASGQIERRDRISQQEFLENYYATNTPLVLTGMARDWPAMSKWTPDYIKANYGDVEVEVQLNRESNPDYEIEIAKHKQTMNLGTYTDWVTQGGMTNDFYMVANNGNLDRPELKGLFDDIQILPEFFNPEDCKGRVFFWFGPAGTITPLHHDCMNIMMAHIYGRKRWRLINPIYTPLLYNHIGVFSQIDLENPDITKFPLFKEVQVSEVVLSPGEILFVPVGWWHQVKGLDVTLSVSQTNFVFPNQYQFRNPSRREAVSIASAS